MTENTHIDLLVKLRKIDRMLVSTVINACISQGAKYLEKYGFAIYSNHKDYKGTLEDAIDILSKNEGMLWFDTKGIGVYQLSFRTDKIERQKVGHIHLSAYGRTLEIEDLGPENAKYLINIAKSIWDALDEKPIYGHGDDEYALPEYMESRSDPSDNDILALNVPINRFWLNFYGKAMIKKFGKEKLKKDAYSVEELDEGLLVVTDVVPKAYQLAWKKKR